jgi:hypothetical protein
MYGCRYEVSRVRISLWDKEEEDRRGETWHFLYIGVGPNIKCNIRSSSFGPVRSQTVIDLFSYSVRYNK